MNMPKRYQHFLLFLLSMTFVPDVAYLLSQLYLEAWNDRFKLLFAIKAVCIAVAVIIGYLKFGRFKE